MQRRNGIIIVSSLLLIGLLLGALIWRDQQAQQGIAATLTASGGSSLSVARAVRGEDDQNFARVTEPRPFSFPADHGPHREYRTEWWYLTGNLKNADGRHFGYQLTFFRQSLRPDAPQRSSNWAAQEVYLAHLGLTDVANNRFYAADQIARGGSIGLAGAQAEPFRVFLKDWSMEGSGENARLRAATDEVAIDLQVRALKPPTLQGDQGYSRKGPEAGNATYYYSFTRMETSGTITIGGQPIEVAGLSWLDREWGTSLLSEDVIGWDWFSVQLADGRDIMWYLLRRTDGTPETGYSRGTITGPNGEVESITSQDVEIEVLNTWLSPHTGARYPAHWRLRIPRVGLDLDIRPLIPDQELRVGFQYWEGAVAITGTSNGQSIAGNGYVELTGYVDLARAATQPAPANP